MSHLRLGLLGILLVFGVQWTLSVISTALAAGLVATALMFLILLATTGCGRLALRSVGPSGLSESEKTLIGATLGLGLLSQGTFLLGIAGLLRPWAAGALLCAFWIVGFTELRDAFRSLGANWNLWRERPVFAAALLGLIAAVFWTSWVPPHQYDSLVYHLALPAAYLRAGKITAVGHLLYSYFPQNGEMLFAVGLLLGSDLVAQMFSWLAFLLSAAWVFEISKREMPLTAALLACGLLASHTAVMLLAAVTYVETMAMLWVTASVLAFFRWSEIPDEPAGRGWLVLSAIFAGLGIGTKYYVGICPAALCLMLAVRTAFIRRRTEGPGASAVFSFAGIVAACAAPWLLRNAFTVGNPFFPFFYSLLPHRGVPWAQENAQGYFRMLTEYGHPEGWLMELLKFPFRIASGSLRFGGG
ncbi:MAG: glycosyltransferase family 39 protein, partial [Elusimicrobia bacterium]|nr:glycosyltransferase family 39 protein [Elusimicrobiota bacterium]